MKKIAPEMCVRKKVLHAGRLEVFRGFDTKNQQNSPER